MKMCGNCVYFIPAHDGVVSNCAWFTGMIEMIWACDSKDAACEEWRADGDKRGN